MKSSGCVPKTADAKIFLRRFGLRRCSESRSPPAGILPARVETQSARHYALSQIVAACSVRSGWWNSAAAARQDALDHVDSRAPSVAARTCPIDISPDALIESSTLDRRRARQPLHVSRTPSGLSSRDYALLDCQTQERILALYSSARTSAVSNPRRCARAVRSARRALAPGDGLLIGYVLKEDRAMLELAYDDPTGVTAAFNRSLLARISRELSGDFDLGKFSFIARDSRRTRRRRAHRTCARMTKPRPSRFPVAGVEVAFEA